MFKIQISNPEVLQIENNESLNIEDAIESVFPLETEFAFLIWNHIYIPLSYKYDIALMVLDFIRIISFIDDIHTNSIDIHWASNTFASVWHLKKEGDGIKINTTWVNVIGEVKDLLNKYEQNFISYVELASEIKLILMFLKKSLEKSGYDTKSIEGFDKLEQSLA